MMCRCGAFARTALIANLIGLFHRVFRIKLRPMRFGRFASSTAFATLTAALCIPPFALPRIIPSPNPGPRPASRRARRLSQSHARERNSYRSQRSSSRQHLGRNPRSGRTLYSVLRHRERVGPHQRHDGSQYRAYLWTRLRWPQNFDSGKAGGVPHTLRRRTEGQSHHFQSRRERRTASRAARARGFTPTQSRCTRHQYDRSYARRQRRLLCRCANRTA